MSDRSEAQMAEIVVRWLQDDGWEVYQEVSVGYSCSRADIVGIKNGLSWVIECKKNYGLGLLEQALAWVGAVNFVSAACPLPRRCRGYVAHICHEVKGVGLIDVGHNSCVTLYKPKLMRLRSKHFRGDIRHALVPEQKEMAAAGSANGGYWTPFKHSVREITDYVRKHPGASIKEVVDAVGALHWSNPQSAKGCIAKYLRRGIFKDIEDRGDGRCCRLFLKATETTEAMK